DCEPAASPGFAGCALLILTYATHCRCGLWFKPDRAGHSPPKLGGVPSRSEGGAVCSKTRSDIMDIRVALLIDRCATRISKRMLRDVEQTAPALASRRASPPNSGGDYAHRYVDPYLGHTCWIAVAAYLRFGGLCED